MEQQKRLYRSKTDRVLCGLCGGLGRYLNIDSNLIRLLFLLVGVIRPEILIAYIVACLIIPEEPFTPTGGGAESPPPSPLRIDETTILAVVLLVVGISILLSGLSIVIPFLETKWPFIFKIITNLPEANLVILVAWTLIGLLLVVVGLLLLRRVGQPK